jgi:hypothetical protein
MKICVVIYFFMQFWNSISSMVNELENLLPVIGTEGEASQEVLHLCDLELLQQLQPEPL